jgi:hypothetical protein
VIREVVVVVQNREKVIYAVPYFFAGSSPGLSWETVDAGYGCIVGGRRYEDAPAKKLSPEKLKMCSNDVILNV